MKNPKPLFREKGKWKDSDYELELHPLNDHCDLSQVDQIQAVCFLDSNRIVFYKNIEGYLGNPGGTVEKGESIEETIIRELIEEAQLKLIDWKTIGFEEVFYPNKLESEKKSCFLRIVAKVELIDKPINDPDGKAIDRVVVKVDQAAKKLNWGEKGEKLIELGRNKYIQTWGEK